MSAPGQLGAVRGTALYVAAIVGPGILTLPALAAAQAGPASLTPLGLLLILSAPIAYTFVALSAAAPGASGIAGYAAAAFGPAAGRLAAAWFRYGVPIGVPALGLIGGRYVAEATDGGEVVVLAVAITICGAAILLSILQRAGSGPFTLLLTVALVLLVSGTAIASAPHFDTGNLTPFAPAGPAAVAASTLVLTWVLTGWEAAANFTRVLRDPRRTLPKATAATLLIVAALYAAVAVSEILVLGPDSTGEAPLAAMLSITLGTVGGIVAAAIAVVIAFGNSLAYVGSLAEVGVDPTSPVTRSRRRRARDLAAPIVITTLGLLAAAFTPIGTRELISICAGSQVPVYVLALAAGVKLLPRWSRAWWGALIGTTSVAVLLVPAGPYLAAPALIAAAIGLGRLAGPPARASRAAGRQPRR